MPNNHYAVQVCSGTCHQAPGKMYLIHVLQRSRSILIGVRLQVIIPLLAALFLNGCASLPPRPDLAFEQALPAALRGKPQETAHRFNENHGSEASGFRLLIHADQSLNARLALIDSATTAIDLQYFIWKDDAVGILLLDRIMKAADRGVKIRVILDDVWLASSTRMLTKLNSHPNLELRLFNPNPSRDNFIRRELHFIASFHELNRRMHNKLMIVDNHVAIAGGRNIGNEYFGLSKKFNFLDIDVIAVGDVVEEGSKAFDDYWNTDTVYPVSGWQHKFRQIDYAKLRDWVALFLKENAELLQSYSLQPQNWENWFVDLENNLHVGEAYFLQDDPVKIDGQDYRLIDMIDYFADPTEEEFIISSPYFIPVGDSLKMMKELEDNNVRFRILTNSLASTNHTLVNSHYKKYRRDILKTGAELYEFNHQPSADVINLVSVSPVTPSFVSLHAKVLISDKQKCFIGSLNFDPRALIINSENGLLIDSPSLAEELAAFLAAIMGPENSWHVSLNQQNSVEWNCMSGRRTTQPARGFCQTVRDFLGRFLPIEGQL